MSIQAMSWALAQQIITNPAARHVLLCLANYADQDGRSAFPSVATLVSDTGLSERTVRAKLGELEKAGVLKQGNQRVVEAYIDRGDRRPICYDILLNNWVQLTEKRGAANAGRGERGANCAATGCNSRTNGVQMVPERGAGAAPNPSDNNPLNNPLNKTVNDYAGFDLDKFDFAKWQTAPSDQVMASWVAMRKKNKYVLTQVTIDRIGAQLAAAARFGFSVDECLGQATEGNWRGFKAEWMANKSGQVRQQNQRGNGRADYFRSQVPVDYSQGVDENGKF